MHSKNYFDKTPSSTPRFNVTSHLCAAKNICSNDTWQFCNLKDGYSLHLCRKVIFIMHITCNRVAQMKHTETGFFEEGDFDSHMGLRY